MTNTITVQRERSRAEAMRAAEWAEALAAACDWLADHLEALELNDEARRVVARDMIEEARKWRVMAAQNGVRNRERADTIAATLAAAARPQPNRGGAL